MTNPDPADELSILKRRISNLTIKSQMLKSEVSKINRRLYVDEDGDISLTMEEFAAIRRMGV